MDRTGEAVSTEGNEANYAQGWEEVVVPSPKKAPMQDNEKLVTIDQLPDWAQIPFKGMKSLTASSLKFTLVRSFKREHARLCSHGAGKTNVAMLTVLRQLQCSMEDGVIRPDRVRVVYVAPMKALAAEVVRKFGSRLLGLVSTCES